MRPIPFFSTKINKGLLRKIQGLLVPRKNYQNIFTFPTIFIVNIFNNSEYNILSIENKLKAQRSIKER